MNLNSCQQLAVDKFVDFLLSPSESELIISGKAGTGKSTLVSYLIDVIPSYFKTMALINAEPEHTRYDIQLAATTNKAAKVLSEKTGRTCVTIHNLIGLTVQNNTSDGSTYLKKSRNYRLFNPGIIIIDEASFIDEGLLREIRAATIKGCKIVYIGDPYQLAPVKSTTKIPPVFVQGINEVRLQTIMRNPGAIELAAERYREAVDTGNFLPLLIDAPQVIHTTGAEFQALVDEYFVHREEPNNKILAWSNDRVINYNNYIREAKGITDSLYRGEEVITNNPIITSKDNIPTDSHLVIEDFYHTEKRGILGKYITFENEDVTVFQPDCQFQAKQLMRQFAKAKDWVSYFEIKERWADLRPIHSCTAHKSQGSTYNQVFIDLNDMSRCNIPSDFARMMYVAISRASERVILYGNLPTKYGG